MSKTNQQYKTKYDKKIAARKALRVQEEKELKLWKIGGIAFVILVLCAILVPVLINVQKKNEVVNGTYIQVGNHNISKLEYDFYYYTVTNSYVNQNGYMLSYLGLDTSKPYDEQWYMEEDGMTWKDYFDSITVNQIKEVYSILDKAQENGFQADVTDGYESYVEQIKNAAVTDGSTLKDYYKAYFGPYATEQNVEKFIKDGFISTHYYEELITQNLPEEDEINSVYEENKNAYDVVDFKLSSFEVDVDLIDLDEGITDEQWEYLEQDAKNFMDDGAPFTQEDTMIGANFRSLSPTLGEWVFDDSRKEGDIATLKDEDMGAVYVVSFDKRYCEDQALAGIADSLSSEKVNLMIEEWSSSYEVKDLKGELTFLK